MTYRVTPHAIRLSPRTWSKSRLLRGAATAALAFVVVHVQGCATHDCEPTTMRCSSNQVETCEDKGCDWACSYFWLAVAQCGGSKPVCVVVEHPTSGNLSTAFCAQSADPSPSCAGNDGFCTADTAVTCMEGLVVQSKPCASPKTCDKGKCTDPRCPRVSETDFSSNPKPVCDGAVMLSCLDGDSVDSKTCAGRCVDQNHRVFCSLTLEPDPHCLTTDDDAYCDGTGPSGMVHCIEGFPVEHFKGSSAGTCPAS